MSIHKGNVDVQKLKLKISVFRFQEHLDGCLFTVSYELFQQTGYSLHIAYHLKAIE